LISKLPPPLPDTVRVIVDGHVVLLHNPTQIILSSVKFVAPRRDGPVKAKLDSDHLPSPGATCKPLFIEYKL